MVQTHRQDGFTLVEMVTVIVILGLMAVAVVPRLVQNNAFESRTAADSLIAALRQAQQLAMSKDNAANVQVITDNANKRVRITYTESGTQNIDVTLPNNLTITDHTIGFRKNGDAALGSTLVISLTPGTRNVCVEPTGYAHAC